MFILSEVWPNLFHDHFLPIALNKHISMISRSRSIRITFFFIFRSVPGSTLFFFFFNSTQSWWCKTQSCNPKLSDKEFYSNSKFQGNRIKTVVLIVLWFFRKNCSHDVIMYVNMLNSHTHSRHHTHITRH